jgi:DNA polymerase-3 subunit delta'
MHSDLREELRLLSDRVTFEWIEKAAAGLDELEGLRRRNIQKQIALEAFALRQRAQN